MCKNHPGDTRKAQAFWAYEIQLDAPHGKKKEEKSTGGDFARGEWTLCELISFPLLPLMLWTGKAHEEARRPAQDRWGYLQAGRDAALGKGLSEKTTPTHPDLQFSDIDGGINSN